MNYQHHWCSFVHQHAWLPNSPSDKNKPQQNKQEQPRLEMMVPTQPITSLCSNSSLDFTWSWFHGLEMRSPLNVMGLLNGTETCGSGKGLLWEVTMKLGPWFSSNGTNPMSWCIVCGFGKETSSSYPRGGPRPPSIVLDLLLSFSPSTSRGGNWLWERHRLVKVCLFMPLGFQLVMVLDDL